MAFKVADRVLETTTTSGTGTLSLAGAVAGYQSFVSGIGTGNTTYYTIYDAVAQVWEVGVGTVTSGSPNTLSRTTVLSNSSGTTVPLTLAGNTSNVFCAYPAEKAVIVDTSSNVSGLTGGISTPTYLAFNTTPTVTPSPGYAFWNSTQGGLEVQFDSSTAGTSTQDNFYYVKASAAITKGQVCYFTGAVGASGVMTAAPASGNIDGQNILGIAAENIANNGFGYIQWSGTLQGINLSSYTTGQKLYYDPTVTGGLTATAPAKNTVQIVMGVVANAANNGTFVLKMTYYGQLEELSEVSISSPTSGQSFYYNGTTWVNGTLPVAGGGTGLTSLTANYIPYGNGTSAFNNSSSFTFNGTTLSTPAVTATESVTGSLSAGAFNYGTLTYSETGLMASYQASINNYAQMILQNSNSGAAASADFVVSNNLGTASTYYGDFGMNSSTFTGSGSFNLPNAVYVYSYSGDLVLGTQTSNAIHFVVNNGTTDAMTINSSGAISVGTWNASTITVPYGGTGATTLTGYVYGNGTSAMTASTTIPGSAISSAVSSATNIASGAANQIPYQTGSSATSFITAPTTASTYLQWTGSAFTWATAGSGGTSNYTRTAFTATSGQTTFSVTYAVGYVEVYVNGVLLNASDYTATNGTSVVLAVGANTGDIVEFIAWTLSTLASTASAVTFNNSGTGAASGTTFNGSSPVTVSYNTLGAGPPVTITTTSTNASYYLGFQSATSGTATADYVNSNITVNPSTGALSAPEMVASNAIYANSQTVTSSYTIASGNNAASVGPITVTSSAVVTISSGSRWLIS